LINEVVVTRLVIRLTRAYVSDVTTTSSTRTINTFNLLSSYTGVQDLVEWDWIRPRLGSSLSNELQPFSDKSIIALTTYRVRVVLNN